MTPIFSLTAAGADITGLIARRLIDLTLTDEAGIKSDSLDLTLDDRDARIALPSPGAAISVSLGYKETGLVFMGTYIADEVTLSGPPRTIAIRAQAADMGGRLKSMKTRNWDDVTLGRLVEAIAAEHGLKPAIAKTLAETAYEHIAQIDESDMNLLTRLAKPLDAIAAVKAQTLLLAERAAGKSVNGTPLPVIALTRGDIARYRVTMAERGKYRSVIAAFHDKETGKTRTVTAGEGDPALRIRHVYRNAQSAGQAARAKLKALTRGKAALSLTLPGNPAIAAESQIRLSGIRPGVDGLWSAASVTHSLDASGLKTQIEAQTPNAGAEEDAETRDGQTPDT